MISRPEVLDNLAIFAEIVEKYDLTQEQAHWFAEAARCYAVRSYGRTL